MQGAGVGVQARGGGGGGVFQGVSTEFGCRESEEAGPKIVLYAYVQDTAS